MFTRIWLIFSEYYQLHTTASANLPHHRGPCVTPAFPLCILFMQQLRLLFDYMKSFKCALFLYLQAAYIFHSPPAYPTSILPCFSAALTYDFCPIPWPAPPPSLTILHAVSSLFHIRISNPLIPRTLQHPASLRYLLVPPALTHCSLSASIARIQDALPPSPGSFFSPSITAFLLPSLESKLFTGLTAQTCSLISSQTQNHFSKAGCSQQRTQSIPHLLAASCAGAHSSVTGKLLHQVQTYGSSCGDRNHFL